MADFESTDRRGFAIVFTQARFDHARDRGHFGYEPGTWQTVMTAFESAAWVFDNPPLEEFRVETERVADERYVSYVPVWKEFLVIPVMVKTVPVPRLGRPTLNPPVRLAVTAYRTATIPTGNILWKWPPDES